MPLEADILTKSLGIEAHKYLLRNVHMSRARKKGYFTEDSSKKHLHEQVKSAHDWAQKEYEKEGEKYEAAIQIKSDFYEGFLALGQQQFEQAKPTWYYNAISNRADSVAWPSTHCMKIAS